MKLVFYIFVWAVMATVSCRDGVPLPDPIHVINESDTVPAVITVNKPTSDQVFSSGSTVTVEGKVTDIGLYRGQIKIVNDATNFLVKEQSYEIHSLTEYNFSLSHPITVTTPSDFTVTVWFEDHGLNVTTKTVKIKVNP